LAEIESSTKVLENSEENIEEKNQIKSDYTTITDIAELNNWIENIKETKIFAFDTETTSLNAIDARIVGICLCIKEGFAAYIPVAHDYEGAGVQLNLETVLKLLSPLLSDPSLTIIGQNLKYDIQVLENYNIKISCKIYDTMLESYVYNSVATKHNMDSLAKHYLDYTTITYEEVAGKGAKQVTFNQVDIAKAAEYGAEDADITLRLHNFLFSKIELDPKLKYVFENIEIPLIKVLQQMERNGVNIDAKLLSEQSSHLSIKLEELVKQAYILAGEEFNLSSPKQLQQILFEKLEIPVVETTPTGQPSTAENVLQELSLEYELPKVILEHRSLSKLKSTYIDKLPEQINSKTGRVHTSYQQAVTATGRLSSTDPNLQNIPIRSEEGRKIRQAFVAPSGSQILAADYSQIELRIMAHLSQDEGLLLAFSNSHDIHNYTASEIFGVDIDKVNSEQRRKSKAINFGLIYGMSAFGLAKQLHVGRQEAQKYMDHYFERYPGVKVYMESTRAMAAEKGYVETLLGRRLYLPEIKAKNMMRRKAAERAAINAPMQGTAADIIKCAMINMYDWLSDQKNNVKLIMQVHDELVFEVQSTYKDVAVEKVKDYMQNAMKLAVPLIVSTGMGNNWDEAH